MNIIKWLKDKCSQPYVAQGVTPFEYEPKCMSCGKAMLIYYSGPPTVRHVEAMCECVYDSENS